MKKNSQKKWLLGIILLALIILPGRALAIADLGTCSYTTDIFETIRGITNTAKAIVDPSVIFTSAICILYGVMGLLLALGAITAAIFIAISGISYMTSAGNPTKQTNALKGLNTAIIGFALLITAYASFNFFTDFMEYDAYTNQFQSANINFLNIP